MIILGINAFHGDASACIFIDNKLVAAAEEERFTRIKHSAGFPINAINFCLKYSKIKINDVDHIAINRKPNQKIFQKLMFASKNIFNYKFIINRFNNLKKINSLKNILENYFGEKLKTNFHQIDHHTAHIASSIFFSGYENSNFISVDGFGDFASTRIGYFDGKKISEFNEVLFPHSLGLFYTAITQYLGFLKYGDEYKVMGLAPYGKPIYAEKLRKILIQDKKKLFYLNLDYFKHHTGNVEMTWLHGEPKIAKVYTKKLLELLGPDRNSNDKIEQIHMDIASSAQKIYEDVLFFIANRLYEINNNNNLCISGGCGMNSVANGKIIFNTKYDKVYVPPAPGDSGGAIGAAVFFIKKKSENNLKFFDNPYLGPSYSNDDIYSQIKKNENLVNNKEFKIEKIESNELMKLTAKLLSEENIIGLFQGRMEWGPRALGNRSILADPRNPNIRETLNIKIKRREMFRPFAPSILKEKTHEWFEVDDDVPFMSKVYQIIKNKQEIIPAVTHIDGSGRLQTVTKKFNVNYYNLINFFYEFTNVPIVLNTSFNENEPIVCTPQEALDCFMRTKMDYLIMENYIIGRKPIKI